MVIGPNAHNSAPLNVSGITTDYAFTATNGIFAFVLALLLYTPICFAQTQSQCEQTAHSSLQECLKTGSLEPCGPGAPCQNGGHSSASQCQSLYQAAVQKCQGYAVGGIVSGLEGTVILNENSTFLNQNSTATLSISQNCRLNSTFAFPPLSNSSTYTVSIQTQPVGQTCTPFNNSGQLAGVPVTNVAILCSSPQPSPVWGFADLHSHPASHLGFGADRNGENGLMWGKPAHDGQMDLTSSNRFISQDLPPCAFANISEPLLGVATGTGILSGLGPDLSNEFTHNSKASDLVTEITDNIIITQLDKTSPGWTHGPEGAPGFQNWPNGLSVDHQVMHISEIHRAFQGGLRLLFASATDNELISDLWTQTSHDVSTPTHTIENDYLSAKKQLTYITNLVNANSSWMQIVRTPSEARAAITSTPPHLAVVLSLELDSLSIEQIQSLVQQFGVAHVIPIHLVNSPSFGGTALYSDQFNSLNYFINGSFYQPVHDTNVNFSLGVPQTLQYETIVLWPFPTLEFFLPQNAPAGSYPTTTGNDVNSVGLNQPNFYTLMQMGLLLDIVHMGEKSASDALALAQQYNYPLMDSHTGIRCDGSYCSTPYGSPASPGPGNNVNERSLPTSQLRALVNLGGVIGLGEVPGILPGNVPDPDPTTTWLKNYKIALSLMGGRRVALGTDANGLSPLIQKDTVTTQYPIDLTLVGGPRHVPELDPFTLGNSRKFYFDKDGIANYGLLPDFIAALTQKRPGIGIVTAAQIAANKAQVAALYHSAEDTIEMWEAVEKALLITTPSSLSSYVNVPFEADLTARGGSPPYTWTLAGSLPEGLTFSASAGTISGTPTSTGDFQFTVYAQDSSACHLLASQQFSVSVSAPITPMTCPAGQQPLSCTYGGHVVTSCAVVGEICPGFRP